LNQRRAEIYFEAKQLRRKRAVDVATHLSPKVLLVSPAEGVMGNLVKEFEGFKLEETGVLRL